MEIIDIHLSHYNNYGVTLPFQIWFAKIPIDRNTRNLSRNSKVLLSLRIGQFSKKTLYFRNSKLSE